MKLTILLLVELVIINLSVETAWAEKDVPLMLPTITINCGSEVDGDVSVTRKLNIYTENGSHSFSGALGKLPGGGHLGGTFDLYPRAGLIYVNELYVYLTEGAYMNVSGVHMVDHEKISIVLAGPGIKDPEGLFCTIQANIRH